MTSEWTKVKISEVCDMIVDCVNKTAPQVEYKTAFKMIRTPQIKGGRIDREKCRYVERETFEKWTRRARVLKGDVLLTREAPMGEIGYVDFDDTVFLGQRIMQYRVNVTQLDSKFLLYSFLSPALQNQFRMHEGSGSVVSHIRVPDCLNFELSLPPLDLQRKIAKILGDLDDKIELNRQTNQTLEQIAQALFKSWFVDFEPTRAKIAAKEAGASPEEIERAAMCAISGKTPDQLAQLPPETQQTLKTTAALFPDALVDSELGEVPEGWGIQKLEDVIELAYGKALKKEDRIDGEFPVYGSGGVTGTNKESLVNGPGIIVGRKGTVGSLYWEDKNFFAIDTVFYVICKNNMTLEFSYYLLQTLGLEDMNTDAAVPGLNRNNAYRLEIIKAPDELISSFSNITRTLRNSIRLNLEGVQSLQAMRDNLLPKLLSGEIEVSNVN